MEKRQAIRVRIVKGPDETMLGRIGYLFDFTEGEIVSKAYIITIDEGEVKRLIVSDGYEYEIEEI